MPPCPTEAGAAPDHAAVRRSAAEVYHQVRHQGRSLSAALPAAERGIDPSARALLRELSYGSLRHAPRLDFWLARLLNRPLRPRDAKLGALLAVALYDLFFLRTPDHAAVFEAVSAARQMFAPWAVKLTNAVLRNAQRRKEALSRLTEADAEARYAHPAWLLARLRRDWPDDWERIALANNRQAPMTLRVNLSRAAREHYLARLAAEGLEARAVPHAPAALTLAAPVDVSRLPGFEAGDVSVQDAAAQLAAQLLAPAPGDRVLDACAAPGGKTAHLLERAGGALDLTAVDSDPARMRRLQQTLRRLGLTARVETADFADLDRWWDARPFTHVLLDAPCSATGVIRRHPDIKSLRREQDIAALARRQRTLLEAAWRVLAPGGRLVYATCSVLREENADQVAAFLADHPDAVAQRIEAGWGRAEPVGRQILPGEDDMDGFYYAVLGKRAG